MHRPPRLRPRSRHDERDARGFASVEFLVATAFSLLLLTLLTNVVVVQYGRGVVRAAADEGARAGSNVDADSPSTCQARADDVLSGLGRMASDVHITCREVNGAIVATTSAAFEGWLPTVPTMHADAVATVHKERAPA
jgi:hypothetical protein